MNTKLHFLFALLFSAAIINAQETTVNTSMGAGYSNQVYYKLSTQTETVFAANSWDIAFLRTSNFAQAIRVNGGKGIEVFEASNNINDWNTIDVANESSWTKLYNSDTVWNDGAFSKGSATYGWGEYNIVTHTVEGTVIFVLKYADGSYKKFINESYQGAYNFKYSNWDGSSWSTDVTATVANTSNPNNKYNYYSLQDNTEVVAEPAIANWDIKFTRYFTEVAPNTQYLVTGVLHNDLVEVAENDEPGGMPANPTLTYSTAINTVGYDWKSFSGAGFTVDSDKAFYIKYADDTIYRIYFTTFSGSASGDLTFKFENITNTLSVEEVAEGISFGIYPNPSVDKKINLIYDVKKLSVNKNEVAVYSTTGQKVFQETLKNRSGFYNKTLDLSSLSSGIYILQFNSGDRTLTKKIILK